MKRTEQTLRSLLNRAIQMIQSDIQSKRFQFTGDTQSGIKTVGGQRGLISLKLPVNLGTMAKQSSNKVLAPLTAWAGRKPRPVAGANNPGSRFGQWVSAKTRGFTYIDRNGKIRLMNERQRRFVISRKLATSGNMVHRGERSGIELAKALEAVFANDQGFRTVANSAFLDIIDESGFKPDKPIE